MSDKIKLRMREDAVKRVNRLAISSSCYIILLFYKKTIVRKNILMNMFTMMPALSIACRQGLENICHTKIITKTPNRLYKAYAISNFSQSYKQMKVVTIRSIKIGKYMFVLTYFTPKLALNSFIVPTKGLRSIRPKLQL